MKQNRTEQNRTEQNRTEQNRTVIRDHDKLYLSEDRKNQPKEYFKFIVSKTDEHFKKYSHPKILDIGCATGDFLFYLCSLYPEASFMGMDVMEELLERAKTEVSGSEFVKSNICDLKTLPRQKYDAVFMNGVHSIFDDIDSWLGNAISLVGNNGKLFIFGIFNPENVDVLVKARYSNQDHDAPWQSGWNCFSIKTFENYLEKKNIKSHCFHDFNISIDIPRHESDPFRSWTFLYDDNSRGIINGTMILHKFMLLEISI